MLRIHVLILLLGLAVPAKAVGAGGAAPPAFDGELRVVLDDALHRHDQDHDLILTIPFRDARAGDVWGMALTYNNGTHHGLVDGATFEGDTITLDVSLVIDVDLHIKPATPAYFTITLERLDDQTYTGTFAGQHGTLARAGTATARRADHPPVTKPGWTPVEPDERPRLLFRQSDLPALRAKLDTPIGKAYFAAASRDIVGLGVLYQLTGEARYADRAAAIVRGYRGDFTADGYGTGGFGHRAIQLMFAYDLCHDAWPDDVKRQVEDFAEHYIPAKQLGLMTQHPNYDPVSNYYGPGRAAAAVASLAFWGDAGSYRERTYRAPKDPVALAETLDAVADYDPGDGAPTVAYASAVMPTQWLIAGPIAPLGKSDYLKSLGGTGKARVHDGQAITMQRLTDRGIEDHAFSFSAIDPELVGDGGIDLTRVIPKATGEATVLLYTVLRVEAEAVVTPLAEPGVEMHRAGQELDGEKYYRLAPGLHPLTVVCRMKRPGVVKPRLVPVDDPLLAGRRKAFALQQRLWERRHAAHTATGQHPLADYWVGKSHQQLRWHYWKGIGEGGFQAETGGYANIASLYPALYSHAYHNVFGKRPTPAHDIGALVPRRMMQTVFGPDTQTYTQKLNSVTGWDPKYIALTWPTIEARHKPAVLWGWNHKAGVTKAEQAGRIITTMPDGHLALHCAFVNYPPELEPQHPRETMPLTWHAPTYGLHVARNAFRDGGDIVAQVFTKARPIGGWNHPNAGTFRLHGLGYDWTANAPSREGIRERESVVVMLDNPGLNWGGNGRLTHHETSADGSTILTIDLADVYQPRPAKGATRYDRNLVRHERPRPADAITGWRAYAFDYSGRSGSPLLMVMIDHVTAGDRDTRKEWLWQLPPAGKRGPRVETTLHDQAFTIRQDDGPSLHATFVAPDGVALTRPNRTSRFGMYGGLTQVVDRDNPDQSIDRPADKLEKGGSHRWNCIMATGGETFFTVITLQQGEPPKVTVEGEGLDAVVTVGGRTVRWDGEKIVLGDASL